jgi:hypothetical protein
MQSKPQPAMATMALHATQDAERTQPAMATMALPA